MVHRRLLTSVVFCLLVPGMSPAADALSAPPKIIRFELLIVATSRVDPSKDGYLDLSWPPEKLQDRVRKLEQQGLLDSVWRVRMSGLENQPTSVQFNQIVPEITGIRMPVGPQPPPLPSDAMPRVSVKWQQVGMIVGTAARIEENRDILINLDLIHSRLAPPQPSLRLAEDNDVTMTPPIAASTLRKSVCVPNGETVVVGEDDARRSDENTLLVVLLTARIVERAAARAE